MKKKFKTRRFLPCVLSLFLCCSSAQCFAVDELELQAGVLGEDGRAAAFSQAVDLNAAPPGRSARLVFRAAPGSVWKDPVPDFVKKAVEEVKAAAGVLATMGAPFANGDVGGAPGTAISQLYSQTLVVLEAGVPEFTAYFFNKTLPAWESLRDGVDNGVGGLATLHPTRPLADNTNGANTYAIDKPWCPNITSSHFVGDTDALRLRLRAATSAGENWPRRGNDALGYFYVTNLGGAGNTVKFLAPGWAFPGGDPQRLCILRSNHGDSAALAGATVGAGGPVFLGRVRPVVAGNVWNQIGTLAALDTNTSAWLGNWNSAGVGPTNAKFGLSSFFKTAWNASAAQRTQVDITQDLCALQIARMLFAWSFESLLLAVDALPAGTLLSAELADALSVTPKAKLPKVSLKIKAKNSKKEQKEPTFSWEKDTAFAPPGVTCQMLVVEIPPSSEKIDADLVVTVGKNSGTVHVTRNACKDIEPVLVGEKVVFQEGAKISQDVSAANKTKPTTLEIQTETGEMTLRLPKGSLKKGAELPTPIVAADAIPCKLPGLPKNLNVSVVDLSGVPAGTKITAEAASFGVPAGTKVVRAFWFETEGALEKAKAKIARGDVTRKPTKVVCCADDSKPTETSIPVDRDGKVSFETGDREFVLLSAEKLDLGADDERNPSADPKESEESEESEKETKKPGQKPDQKQVKQKPVVADQQKKPAPASNPKTRPAAPVSGTGTVDAKKKPAPIQDPASASSVGGDLSAVAPASGKVQTGASGGIPSTGSVPLVSVFSGFLALGFYVVSRKRRS